MAKSITDNQKKSRPPGRPKTTGITPMTGVRLPADLEAAVLGWARSQGDRPNKAEAIRRLLVRALAARAAQKSGKK
jgi:Arc/MetJ-type ribon-helix-helix transcriptional regulator